MDTSFILIAQSNEQIIIGVASAILCLWGLVQSQWFYRETKKGRRLASWFGETKGLWLLRSLFLAGILFGIALALDFIRPIFA